MKLRLIILAAVLFFSVPAKSQAFWILVFGDKMSNEHIQSGINVSVAAVNYIGFNKSNYLGSWALGGFTDIIINEKWSLQPEFVFKSPTGANNMNDYYSFLTPPDSIYKKANIYIEAVNYALPVYIKYKTRVVGFGIGPQFNFAYSTQLKLKGKTHDDTRVMLKRSIADDINKFDVGISTMLEFYLSPEKKKTSMRLSLKYYYGFLDVFKGTYHGNNSVFMISLGIPVVAKTHIKP